MSAVPASGHATCVPVNSSLVEPVTDDALIERSLLGDHHAWEIGIREDMMQEIHHLFDQMMEAQRRAYLQEPLSQHRDDLREREARYLHAKANGDMSPWGSEVGGW